MKMQNVMDDVCYRKKRIANMNPEIGIRTTATGKLLSVVYIILAALFVITFGIAIPITGRWFYALHIDGLHLTEITPWTREQIMESFHAMMNFIWQDAPFGTGDLKWSQAGMEHFADCRMLFWLDIKVLVVSAAGLLFMVFLTAWLRLKPYRFLGFGALFWAGVSVFALFGVVFILGAVNFDKAFVVFHKLFFPGKTNWLFDPTTDEIIRILPEQYFMDCAILAISVIAAVCIAYMIIGKRKAVPHKEMKE